MKGLDSACCVAKGWVRVRASFTLGRKCVSVCMWWAGRGGRGFGNVLGN
jgi:hypothetical protein